MNRLVRAFSGLRTRVVFLLFAGLAVQAIGFQLLHSTLTRNVLYGELESRHRSVAAQLAEQVVTPMVVGDSIRLATELRRAAFESDVLAVAAYSTDGTKIAGWANEPGIWSELAPITATLPTLTAHTTEIFGRRALQVTAPVRLKNLPRDHGAREAQDLLGVPESASTRRGPVALGTVRVVASTERVEAAVDAASRLGFMVLLVTLLIGFGAVAMLVGVVVRPLREAGSLASEIARGELSRRMPVRSDDEIGALAQSMNTMAEALESARGATLTESERLRVATEAVIAIAREARITHEPHEVFKVVSTEMQRVTGCQGAVLAEPGGESGGHVITHLDPPSPWVNAAEGDPLDAEIVLHLDAEAATRVTVEDEEDDGLSRLLRSNGYECALLVPLALELGPPALLILAARNRRAFPAQEAEIVAGLASHLCSALRAMNLHRSLETAIAELDRTRDYLVQSGMLRVAGEMAAGVAHEFNNILGAVLGRAQLLRRDVENGTCPPETLVHALEIIERVAHDGGETVRRLRLFSRNGETAAVEPVEVDGVLRDAVEFTSPRWSNQALASGRTIHVDIVSSPGLWVVARPHELREVFTNLILNANDALPDGGTIRIAAVPRGDDAIVTVTDDGIGMSDATRARLFEPFFTTKGESGTGLGMSVVYGIVQRHRGEIEVKSAPGRGTRVTVQMPLTRQRPAEVVPREMPRTARVEPLEVLIIDDEAPVRDLLSDIVKALGHHVTSYGNGIEAMSEYIPGRYQLVLTDVGMPGLTGWQVADVVRSLDPDVLLAFVTGWADGLAAEDLEAASVDALIGKPFSIEDVQKVIEAAVHRLGKAA